MHLNDLGVRWIFKFLNKNDEIAKLKDKAGRGRGARLSIRPLQLGENQCIILIIYASYGTLQYQYFQKGNPNRHYVAQFTDKDLHDDVFSNKIL